jgi:hypothetical protein
MAILVKSRLDRLAVIADDRLFRRFSLYRQVEGLECRVDAGKDR